MIGDRAARLPEAGAGPVRVRDRRGGHAAGQGRPRRHRGEPAGRIRGASKLLTTAAVIMSVFLITTSFVTTLLIPQDDVRGRRRGQRPRPGLPGPRVPRHGLRHRLRHHHHRHPLVRRRLGDGRPAQPGAALPAPLRHGPGLGPGGPAAGAGLHRDRLPGDLDLRRGRRRPGRRLRHRRAGADHLGRGRRDPRRPAGPASAAGDRLRRHRGGLRLHHRRQHRRAPRRREDRCLLHRRHRRRLAALPARPRLRTAGHQRRAGRHGQRFIRDMRPPHDPVHRQRARRRDLAEYRDKARADPGATTTSRPRTT